MQPVFAPVFGFVALIGAVAVSIIVVRFATAYIKRLEAPPPGVAPPDQAIGELREELDYMQERLDFLERAMIARKNPRGRALSSDEALEGTVPTPA